MVLEELGEADGGGGRGLGDVAIDGWENVVEISSLWTEE